MRASVECARCGALFRTGEQARMDGGRLVHARDCKAKEPATANKQAGSRYRSKLEERYHAHLLAEVKQGRLERVDYEPVRLRLAEGCWYTPDFRVIRDGKTEFHETKGYMREAARVRLRVAAELHPYTFYLVRADGAGWRIESV